MNDGDSDSSYSLLGWLRRVVRGRSEPQSLRTAVEELIEETPANAGIPADERLLLGNILALHERTAVDCMVPRADIVAVEAGASLQDTLAQMASAGHSRIPVFRETLDNALGFVHIKDILPLVVSGRTTMDLTRLLRPLPFVAPSMPVLKLLLQMREGRQHIALVVDEFGGVDGLVTIEDLVEEIVGDIEDEHDARPPQMVAQEDGAYLADARLPIEDFSRETGFAFPTEETEDIDTLGGFVLSLAGKPPRRGEVLRHGSGLSFDIVDADRRRVKKIRIRLPAPAETATAEG